MCHRPHKSAVLDYGRAAHALYYAAGAVLKPVIGYPDHHALVVAGMVRVNAFYLYGVFPDIPVSVGAQYDGVSGSDILGLRYRYRLGITVSEPSAMEYMTPTRAALWRSKAERSLKAVLRAS